MSTQPQPTPAQSLEELVHDDVVEALMNEGFTRAQSEEAYKCGTGVTFSDLFKTSLNWLTVQRSTRRSIITKPAPRKESSMPAMQPTTAKTNGQATKKYCPGYERECGEVLNPLNRNGLCKRCYARKAYQENYSKKARAGAKEAPQKPVRRAALKSLSAAPPSAARVALELTEAQLNNFLVKLPLAEKQRLANHYLQTAEV